VKEKDIKKCETKGQEVDPDDLMQSIQREECVGTAHRFKLNAYACKCGQKRKAMINGKTVVIDKDMN
jgi:hypothetical protein